MGTPRFDGRSETHHNQPSWIRSRLRQQRSRLRQQQNQIDDSNKAINRLGLNGQTNAHPEVASGPCWSEGSVSSSNHVVSRCRCILRLRFDLCFDYVSNCAGMLQQQTTGQLLLRSNENARPIVQGRNQTTGVGYWNNIACKTISHIL